jgi:glycosyltransferase involved in cell wall biosynthesis
MVRSPNFLSIAAQSRRREGAGVKAMLLAAGSVGHTRRWANGLVQSGVNVVCVSQHDFLAEHWDPRVERVRLPRSGTASYFTQGVRVARLFRDHGCELLNAHYATGYGVLATLSGVRPRLVSVWGSDVYEFPAISPLHRALVRYVVRSADAVASTSEAMARQAERIAGAPLQRPVAITPFGVDTGRFRPGTGSAARHDGRLVIGTVKTLARNYGIDTLIDAFALLRQRASGEALRLRIVGDGPERAALESRAAALGGAVEFVGPVPHDEVPQQLQLLDVYVAASRIESFGVAVIEASACGLPVVVSDAGGLPEAVEDGVTGLVVRRESPPALAEAIARLVDDAALRRSLGEAGRQRVQQRYEWGDCVDRMASTYESLRAASRESVA